VTHIDAAPIIFR